MILVFGQFERVNQLLTWTNQNTHISGFSLNLRLHYDGIKDSCMRPFSVYVVCMNSCSEGDREGQAGAEVLPDTAPEEA